MPDAKFRPILIIGAGISGLTLAQACRKNNLPYVLFEHDSSATARRSAGWGLTLNWSLPTFRSLLLDEILDLLPQTYVNMEAVDAGEKGSFTFFDLSTGEAKWKVPATERIRVSRERLRRVLLQGLEVRWGVSLVDIKKAEGGVTAVLSDGSEAFGCVVVGCDGANSSVRRLCHPEGWETKQLPIRFIGAGVMYPESQIEEIRRLDPFSFKDLIRRRMLFFGSASWTRLRILLPRS
jgi:2-polyprenyl-6-methoxyphenol hydroxylase-like FAD-dependent oxidoreductase